MMFSSTIIGIKLLPTTVLHHRHIGELMIGMLLLQDLLAILVLVVLFSAAGEGDGMGSALALSTLGLPLLAGSALVIVRFVLLPLITRFDRFHEYIFLLALGWCLGMAEAAKALGLSEEIGAFIAGITIATSPISQYIAVNLKPLRDFFLILFFFSVVCAIRPDNAAIGVATGSRSRDAGTDRKTCSLPLVTQGGERKANPGMGSWFQVGAGIRVLTIDCLRCYECGTHQ